jgi:hypothetical protein
VYGGFSPEQILSHEHIDVNLLRSKDYNDGSTCLIPKYYPGEQGKGVTRFEYQVICQCFAEATGTVMECNEEKMWRENLGPFQEWMIDNRHRFKTDSNIKFVTDCISDRDFPRSNNVKMFFVFSILLIL